MHTLEADHSLMNYQVIRIMLFFIQLVVFIVIYAM